MSVRRKCSASNKRTVTGILRACHCELHPLLRAAMAERTQAQCVHALNELLHDERREAEPVPQGIVSPFTVY